MSTSAEVPNIVYIVLAIAVLIGLYFWYTSDKENAKSEGLEGNQQKGGNSDEQFVHFKSDDEDRQKVEALDKKRKFISGGEKKPEEFLPPKTMENSTEYEEENCDFYVNHRIGMDTNAYLPRKSNSRTIYQSIAGDVPINSEPVVASRIVSTYNPPSEGFMNTKNNVLNAELACPY